MRSAIKTLAVFALAAVSPCLTFAQYTRWADQLLHDQVAFIPPTAWEGETVARFAFLHPHTSMELVAEILDRMADS